MKTQRIYSSTIPAAERIQIRSIAIGIGIAIGIVIALAWIGGIAHGQEADASVAPQNECYRDEMKLGCSPSGQLHDCVGVFHCEPNDCSTGSMHWPCQETQFAVAGADCVAHASCCGGAWHEPMTALPCPETDMWTAPHLTAS
jgi:hypothetical protein